jgi:hypothetical protein
MLTYTTFHVNSIIRTLDLKYEKRGIRRDMVESQAHEEQMRQLSTELTSLRSRFQCNASSTPEECSRKDR